MNVRHKWFLIVGASIVALVATAGVGVASWADYENRHDGPSEALTAENAWTSDSRIVFRNTAAGEGYGHVAAVSLDEPAGARTINEIACDRVDAAPDQFSCLKSVRGIVPSYTGTLYSIDGSVMIEWPLSGVPSRTRLSPDGELVATTAFVTGHSYATVGFSTETSIRTRDGEALDSLEDWTLIVGGERTAPVDRNYWGVTFVDDTSFYATVGMATSDATYLVHGDIAARTLTALAENVECPSLSPDGDRIAFKRKTAGAGPTAHWTPAIYDIASEEILLLPESRSIDDQIEWLDQNTILYGMPRDGVPGDSDVWQLPADGSREPTMFIEHAWSPSVVLSAAAKP
ncbi:hypothetical protein ACWPKO_25305 (plasmid) [Coraliomargarita sp. W4R53]